MERDARRIPVIVGAGQINDRPERPEAGLSSLDLMAAALARAEADAGGNWLRRLDSLAVVQQISCPGETDCAATLAARIGAAPRFSETTDYPGGDRPLRLLSAAANRIAAGEIAVAAVAGGEALRTAAARGLADATRQAALRGAQPWPARYGLVAPTDIYPLYENATRAAWGQSFAAAQAETGEIWSRMSEVAASNPDAWLRRRVTAADIVAPSEANRPLAFPYTKLMVANAAVNQGAAFLVTSLAAAREAGVAENRLAYVGAGAAAQEAENWLSRDRYDRSTSMAAVLRAALARNTLATEDLDFVEIYSCFPCIPKMARRIIGWPHDRVVTMVGGLTFGGGPIGNYMSHAVARAVHHIREGAANILLFGNGGNATYNHALVLCRAPPVTTLPGEVAVSTAGDTPPPAREAATGRATIETYTVFHDRTGAPQEGVVVARLADGTRTLAAVPADNQATLAALLDSEREAVGRAGNVIAEDKKQVFVLF